MTGTNFVFWIPPEDTHDISILNTPDSLCTADAKRHQLVYVVLLYFFEPILRDFLALINCNGMRFGGDDLLPIHPFELMHTLNDFFVRFTVREPIP